MIKVATLSFQHAYNYGAVFQVAALQHVITQLGVDCDIIDYRCPAIDKQYDFNPIKLNSSIINAIRANLVLAPFIRSKKKNFQHWMNSYKKTEVIIDKLQLKALNERYDKFIVGSDQVWNLKCQGYDDAFFLEFVLDNTKKIAYAASLGAYNIKPEDYSYYEKYVDKFDFLSVRENRGIELLKEFTSKNVIACVDPVLLAGKNFWESKMDNSFNPSQKYIFVYQLGHGSLVPKFVKQLKNDSNLKVYYVTGHVGNMVYYSLNDKNYSSVSPERFLSMLKNSEYVVTNSFHASVLSILFEKKFFVINKGGEKSAYNGRIYNLLKDYGLLECLVSSYKEVDLNKTCDFLLAKERLKESSNVSISFLKSALNI